MSNEIVDDIRVSTVEISTKSGINLTSNDSRLKHTGDGSLIISSTSSLDNAISINTQNGGFIIDSNGKISINSNDPIDGINIGTDSYDIPITIGSETSVISIGGSIFSSSGIRGPTGPQGATGPGFFWRSAWTFGTQYLINDVVSYNGQSWIATGNSPYYNPGYPGENWELMAEKGLDGLTGATGATGPIAYQQGSPFLWTNLALYNPNDIVSYDGTYWILSDPENYIQSPTPNAGYGWTPFYLTPTGPTGPAGTNGDTGPAGPAGPTGPAGALDSQVVFSGVLSPPSLSATTHNYNPTGLSTCNVLRLSATTDISLTGIQAPSPSVNQFILLVNLGTGNINILTNNAGSSAGNQFINNNDVLLNTNESVIMMYDATSAGWRIFGIQN